MTVYGYGVWLNMGRFEFLKLAYTGSVEAESVPAALNEIWRIFNIDHPEDYKDRSLSVGDIVAIGGNGEVWSVVESGWTRLNNTFDEALAKCGH